MQVLAGAVQRLGVQSQSLAGKCALPSHLLQLTHDYHNFTSTTSSHLIAALHPRPFALALLMEIPLR
jgi:hypothetical protein